MNTPLLSKNEMKFSISESFDIKGNNNNEIKLKISYNKKIIFLEAEEKNVFPKQEFSLYQSLEQLTITDKFFRQYDELKEVFEFIKTIISKNNLSVIKEKDKMKLKLSNSLLNRDIIINLILKERDIKSEIESLIPYIKSLNNKIDFLENKIENMKIEFNNKLNNMRTEFDNRLKENEKNKLFQGSQIIEPKEKELIMDWFDKKPISTQLLLDAQINNNFLQAFFNNCLHRKNTIIFIKTTDNIKFGGFTSVSWPSKGIAIDKNSFVFSLTTRQKFKVINAENAIGVSESNYISFGCGLDLYLFNNLKSEGGGTCKAYYDIPSNENNFYLNGGKGKFNLSNCEIYQIYF